MACPLPATPLPRPPRGKGPLAGWLGVLFGRLRGARTSLWSGRVFFTSPLGNRRMVVLRPSSLAPWQPAPRVVPTFAETQRPDWRERDRVSPSPPSCARGCGPACLWFPRTDTKPTGSRPALGPAHRGERDRWPCKHLFLKVVMQISSYEPSAWVAQLLG